MNLRTRLALSFALVAAVVAGLVGGLSFHAASERVTGEIDATLQTATTAIASGQDQILAPSPPTVPATTVRAVPTAAAETATGRAPSTGSWLRKPSPPTAPPRCSGTAR